jgi:hypothetical protein
MTPIRFEGGPTHGMAALADGESPERITVSLVHGGVGAQVTRYEREPDPETGSFVYRIR